MATNFRLDWSEIDRALRRSPQQMGSVARQALDDIKDDWVRGARDIAPIDDNPLRRSIQGTLKNPGLSGIVEVSANAKQESRGRSFNYALYIHEYDAGGKSLKTPGTVKKFLDESMDEAKATRMLERELRRGITNAGW